MIHMVLCCAAAMSTSLLVEKIKKEAENQGIAIDIGASGVHEVFHKAQDADIVLLAPQVKYIKKQLERNLHDVPVMEISMRDYGTMNGKNVFNDALEVIHQRKETQEKKGS